MNILLNCLAYIVHFLKIRDKDGHVIPFVLNQPQRRLYEVIKEQWDAGKPIRIIILKARQMGFSTLTEAIIFWLTATSFNVETMIVAHKDEATKNLFLMSKRFYDHLPDRIKPMMRASNAQELVFDRPSRYKGSAKGLGSRIRCATAGGEGIGRSYTLRALHLSEFAFWPGDKRETLAGLMQAVPDRAGTMVIIESTANGYDEFKQRWDAAVKAQQEGREGFIPVFFAWHEMDEYRREVPPGFQRTQEEEELSQAFGLDDEQLAWRRWCIENNCGGDLNLFKQEYPATPDEAFIATGMCVFNKDQIVLRRKKVQEEKWERGRFRIKYREFGSAEYVEIGGVEIREFGGIESFEWEPDPSGPIRIRKTPEKGVPYVIGCDTAGTGSDFFAAHVLDNRTGDQVAVVHHQFGERFFAEQIYCLGHYYNEALVGIETNYSTFPEECIEALGYTNLFVRKRVDTFTGALADSFGFETTTKTRPLIIDGLKDVAKQAIETIHDFDTLGEMLTFVYAENWRPQAENGEHDDLVMSLAIAHFIRCQQGTAVDAEEAGEESVWTEDMWEDYNRASPKEQEMLIRMWGQPKR